MVGLDHGHPQNPDYIPLVCVQMDQKAHLEDVFLKHHHQNQNQSQNHLPKRAAKGVFQIQIPHLTQSTQRTQRTQTTQGPQTTQVVHTKE